MKKEPEAIWTIGSSLASGSQETNPDKKCSPLDKNTSREGGKTTDIRISRVTLQNKCNVAREVGKQII
jgi:hypothetical protein